jgi:hypothetical protein
VLLSLCGALLGGVWYALCGVLLGGVWYESCVCLVAAFHSAPFKEAVFQASGGMPVAAAAASLEVSQEDQ